MSDSPHGARRTPRTLYILPIAAAITTGVLAYAVIHGMIVRAPIDYAAAEAAAVELALQHDHVRERVGSPVTNWAESKMYQREFTSIALQERMVVSGPAGEVIVDFEATTLFKKWRIESLVVTADGERVLSLQNL